jgi:hypothetical protein
MALNFRWSGRIKRTDRVIDTLLLFFLITLFLRGAGLLKNYGYRRRKINLHNKELSYRIGIDKKLNTGESHSKGQKILIAKSSI